MANFYFDGKKYVVPTVASMIEIISDAGAALPDFSIPLIIAKQDKGTPYEDDSDASLEPLLLFSQSSAVADHYGRGSDMHRAFEYFKKHRGGVCYCLGLVKTTKATVTLQDDTPADSIVLTAKEYGAISGDVTLKVTVSTGKATFTITPVKDVHYLDVDASSSDTLIYLRDTDGISVGDTFYLSDDETSREEVTVKVVVPGSHVEVESGITGSFAVNKSARIYKLDTANQEVSTELETLSEIVNWFSENSRILDAEIASGATKIPDAVTESALKEIAGATAGSTPAATATDWQDIFDDILPQKIVDTGIRLICPVSYGGGVSADQQANLVSARDFAITQRQDGYPVQIVCGGLLDDVDLSASDYTNPVERAKALNNQDVILAAGGIDGYDPYVATAPAVMGLLAANSVAHNLTRDAIAASTVEKVWNEKTELPTLIDGGVIAIQSKPSGYVIAKGVSTLQKNDAAWNPDDKTTYLPMQRAIADYCSKTLKDGLDDTFIGADEVTQGLIRSYVMNTLENMKNNVTPPLMQSYAIDSITRSQTEGWLVKWRMLPVYETNYIGITTQILVS